MTPLKTDAEGRTKLESRAVFNNRETVESYERCADDYAKNTAPHPSSTGAKILHHFAQELETGSSVLELGSGPGWDADFLESQEIKVRRTDISETFLALQRQRGKAAERLDIITDAFGGGYDGIVALYVFQHLDRSLVADALEKVGQALRPGGVFLISLLEGVGNVRQTSEHSGVFHITLWSLTSFRTQLNNAGLRTQWVEFSTDEEGNWMTFLARKNP